MKASITIRMYYKSLKQIRKVYPTIPGETMASYFCRLAEWLKEKN